MACDARGRPAVEPFVASAGSRHPSLLDEQLAVADLYGVRNVPAAFWIDEAGTIVRANDPIYIQRRNRETGVVAVNDEYLDALREWIRYGERSRFRMDDSRLAARLPTIAADDVQAAVYFHLGVYLAQRGHASDALTHLKRAHALRPGNWTYRRQAWNLGDIERDYGTTVLEPIKDPAGAPFYPPLDLT